MKKFEKIDIHSLRVNRSITAKDYINIYVEMI